VPQVAPATPEPQKPNFNPVALAMLKQKLKQGLPEEPSSPVEVKAAALRQKITKTNGKLKGDTTTEPRNAFEPFPEERLYPKGISPEAYAAAEADAYLGPNVPRGRRELYMTQAEGTARGRIAIIDSMKAKHPAYRQAFDGLLGSSTKSEVSLRRHGMPSTTTQTSYRQKSERN
jgi:hypothetical protein